MYLYKKNNMWTTVVGYYDKTKKIDGVLKIERKPVFFDLGSLESAAQEKEKKIHEAWERSKEQCKKNPYVYNKAIWTQKEIYWLSGQGVISQKFLKRISPTGDVDINRLNSLDYTMPELTDANKLGQWIVARMHDEIRSYEFLISLRKALDVMIEKDPIGTVFMYLDLVDRIFSKQDTTPVNPVQLNVFCNDERKNRIKHFPIVETTPADEPVDDTKAEC